MALPTSQNEDASDPTIITARKRKVGTIRLSSETTTSIQKEKFPMPMRDNHRLFVSQKTVACAMGGNCVPCAYKIGLFDVALDQDFCRQVPNQRPEQCPRILAMSIATPKSTTTATNENDIKRPISEPSRRVMGYEPGMSVLTVGDGDFSFSLALARILLDPDNHHNPIHTAGRKDSENVLHRSSTVIATSYETESTLRRVYPNFDDTVRELHQLGAQTLYQVDATRLEETFGGDRPSFHRICWNFPCTAIAKGQDGQNQEMEDNKQLVRKFVASAMPFLVPESNAEIHICHKTKPPFNQWKLEQVVLEGSIHSSLVYAGRVVLDRALLPPYTPRKALDRKSFPCHDACFYVFSWRSEGFREANPSTKQSSFLQKIAPTLPVDDSSSSEQDSHTSTSSDDCMLSVTHELISSIRSHFLKRIGFASNPRSSKRQRRYR